jgi:hypothetical protein
MFKALLLTLAVASFTMANPPLFPEGVGSNLVFHELGDYAKHPTAENWAKDVKVTLLHYHEHADEVRARLKAMRAAGQTKIALMLWYVEENPECTWRQHYICPKDGKIPEQIERNITGIIKDIAAGDFDTVIIRMAAQGQADPLGEKYDPARAADSWKLFESLHTTVSTAIAGTKLRVLYDLGTETMGHPYSVRPGAQAFLKTMWMNYVKKYPPSETVGFTFNHAYEPSTLECLKIFQASGTWPAAIAIDLYDGPEKFLANLSRALGALGKADFPIIVNETFRNNATMADAFAKAQQKYKLNLRMLLQWPLDKGAAGHSNNPVSTEIDAYKDAVSDLPR